MNKKELKQHLWDAWITRMKPVHDFYEALKNDIDKYGRDYIQDWLIRECKEYLKYTDEQANHYAQSLIHIATDFDRSREESKFWKALEPIDNED